MTKGKGPLIASLALATMGVTVAAVTLVRHWRGPSPEPVRCGQGFVPYHQRCCVAPAHDDGCDDRLARSCPGPLVPADHGCDAPPIRIAVPPTELVFGPSDWEAEGRVEARVVRTRAFAIDAFEVTIGRFRCVAGEDPCVHRYDADRLRHDMARAAYAVTLDEARAFCRSEGGRLPTDDEWLAAASGSEARRYPWGDTGAVCRRAAWGLRSGPCSHGNAGPDTVGSHSEGRTATGIFDLAGNVAEWVEVSLGKPRRRGGSWASSFAADLRTWAWSEGPESADGSAPAIPGARVVVDDEVGFRCAYDQLP